MKMRPVLRPFVLVSLAAASIGAVAQVDKEPIRIPPPIPSTLTGWHLLGLVMGSPPGGEFSDALSFGFSGFDGVPNPAQIREMPRRVDIMFGPFRPEYVAPMRASDPETLFLHYGWLKSIGSSKVQWPPGNLETGWRLANQREMTFLHSADPASLVVIGGANHATLYWLSDRRQRYDDFPALKGYRVLRKAGADAAFDVVGETGVDTTAFTDREVPPGPRVYCVESVAEDGTPLTYSMPLAAAPSPASFSLYHGEAEYEPPLYQGSTKSIRFTVRCEGKPEYVELIYDARCKKSFWESGADLVTERMEASGENRFEKEVTITFGGIWNAGVAFAFRAVAGDTAVRIPNGNEMYSTCVNNRVGDPLYRDSFFVDLRPEQTRADYVARVMKEVDLGYDGHFVDEAFWGQEGLGWDRLVATAPIGFSEDPVGWFGAYREGVVSTLRDLKKALGRRYLWVHPSYPCNEMKFEDLVGLVDLFHIEGFCPYAPQGVLAAWKRQMDDVLALQRLGIAVTLDAKVPARGTGSEAVSRLYTGCSYLVANNGKCFFTTESGEENLSFEEGKERLQRPAQYFPEMTLNLGMPAKTADKIEEYVDAASGIYVREFEHGLVLVNPTNAEKHMDLTPPMFQIRVFGGIIADLGGNGHMKFEEVSEVQVGAQCGAILLRARPRTAG